MPTSIYKVRRNSSNKRHPAYAIAVPPWFGTRTLGRLFEFRITDRGFEYVLIKDSDPPPSQEVPWLT